MLVLGATVIWQAQIVGARNRALSEAMKDLRTRLEGSVIVQPGRALPALRGTDEAGRFGPIVQTGIYIAITMRTTCPVIAGSPKEWAVFSDAVVKRGIPLVWISGDSASQASSFMKSHHFAGRLLADVPFDVYTGLGLAAVPQILLVSDGAVRAAWRGVPDAGMVRDVFARAM